MLTSWLIIALVSVKVTRLAAEARHCPPVVSAVMNDDGEQLAQYELSRVIET
jgi:hypothetical protein